jgi:hypothetical protein
MHREEKNPEMNAVGKAVRSYMNRYNQLEDEEFCNAEMITVHEDFDNQLKYHNEKFEKIKKNNSDTNISNEQNNSLSKSSELKKIVIKPDESVLEEIAESNFNYIKCSNVTSIKIDNRVFSFLSSPQNDDNFFYITMNDKHEYTLHNEKVFYRSYQSRVKIPYSDIKEFTNAMNINTEQLRVDLLRSQKSHIIWDSINFFASIITAILVVSAFSFYVNSLYPMTKLIVQFVLILTAIICVLNYAYKIYNDRKKQKLFDRYDYFLVFQDKVETLISNWNHDCFSKYDIVADVPEGLEYVQFYLKPNIRMKIISHDI